LLFRRIAKLCVIEAEIPGTPDQLQAVRQAHSRPLLDDLESWLGVTLEMLSRKSDTAAILYALKFWPALLRYCNDCAIERHGVRPPGGDREAAIFSLIGTAMLNGIDPAEWLRRYVLAHTSPFSLSNKISPTNIVTT
jgi:transposase